MNTWEWDTVIVDKWAWVRHMDASSWEVGPSEGKGMGTSQTLAGGLLPMIARFPLSLEFLTPLLWKVRLSGPGVKLSLDSSGGCIVTGRTLSQTLPSPYNNVCVEPIQKKYAGIHNRYRFECMFLVIAD